MARGTPQLHHKTKGHRELNRSSSNANFLSFKHLHKVCAKMFGGFNADKYRKDMRHHVIDYLVLKACLCCIVRTAESHQLCCLSSVHCKTTTWFQHFRKFMFTMFPPETLPLLLKHQFKRSLCFHGNTWLIITNTTMLKAFLYTCVCVIYTSLDEWLCCVIFNSMEHLRIHRSKVRMTTTDTAERRTQGWKCSCVQK